MFRFHRRLQKSESFVQAMVESVMILDNGGRITRVVLARTECCCANWSVSVQKWVHDSHRSVEPIVLKILSEDFREAEVFGVRPKVRVEPVQLVSRTCANCLAQHRFLRIEDCELFEQLLRLA